MAFKSGVAIEAPPRLCPSCEHDLSDHPYYQSVPSRTTRILRKIALALLPVTTILYLALLFSPGVNLGFGAGQGYFALMLIGVPSLILYAISRLVPTNRLVICQRCSWNREYPPG